jgi:squalene-hopene/tetraprenyl-beta-curcumene cyclase
MTLTIKKLAIFVALMNVLMASPLARAGENATGWKAAEAAQYLDERQKVWFGSAKCISCHTGLAYALARPALGKIIGEKKPLEQETKLLGQIHLRVANWSKLDSKEFGLYYDSSDEMKKQSWGTEAVFNALILSFADAYQGRSSPSEATKQAFQRLWETQVQNSDHKGSWEWLDFNEPPWGCMEARYFGAALAAIAVGTAPGYYSSGADVDIDARVNLLRGYLRDQFQKQNLHNQLFGLWAAAKVDGILAKTEQDKLIGQLLKLQQADGGWSLPSLGTWSRKGPAPKSESDGYATALVLHVLQTAGRSKVDGQIAKGLDWLKHNQTATGAWRSASLVKKRDPNSHTGRFMSDAATAYAILALSH